MEFDEEQTEQLYCVFLQADADRDGLLNEKELRKLLSGFDIDQDFAPSMMRIFGGINQNQQQKSSGNGKICKEVKNTKDVDFISPSASIEKNNRNDHKSISNDVLVNGSVDRANNYSNKSVSYQLSDNNKNSCNKEIENNNNNNINRNEISLINNNNIITNQKDNENIKNNGKYNVNDIEEGNESDFEVKKEGVCFNNILDFLKIILSGNIKDFFQLLFSAIDANGDGLLEPNDLVVFSSLVGDELNLETANSIVNECTTKYDGAIDFEGFWNWYKFQESENSGMSSEQINRKYESSCTDDDSNEEKCNCYCNHSYNYTNINNEDSNMYESKEKSSCSCSCHQIEENKSSFQSGEKSGEMRKKREMTESSSNNDLKQEVNRKDEKNKVNGKEMNFNHHMKSFLAFSNQKKRSRYISDATLYKNNDRLLFDLVQS